MEALLLVVCVLVYFGYLAVRLSRRMRLPAVTSFLLLGMAAGPDGLDLVSTSVNNSLRIVEPIALGMITFAAGEQLYLADIRLFSRRLYAAVGLETVLPIGFVAVAAWLVTGRLDVALPVGAIAGTTGLATVISTLRESGAKGYYSTLVGFSTASDNFFAILAFSLFLPLFVGLDTGQRIGDLYLHRLAGMVAAIGIGFVAGLVVSRLIKNVRSSHELSIFVLAHVLLVVGITQYLGFSVLLAGLAMGATAVNLTREVRDRDRTFAAIGTLEFPVVAIFFLWAGASLHVRALGGIGALFGAYVVARVVGKLAGPLAIAWAGRRQTAESRRLVGLGVSLVPQAGAAVGLAISARDALPLSGETILATILAAVVVFELVGPVGVHWAARHVGEAQAPLEGSPLTLDEAIKELADRKARVVVLAEVTAGAANLEVPRALAARLKGDLQVIRFTTDSRSGSEPGSVDDDGEDSPLGENAVFAIGSQSPSALLDLVKSHTPDVLFISSPGGVLQLMGTVESLSERLQCPVFEIPGGEAGTQHAPARPRAMGVERAISYLSAEQAKVAWTGVRRKIREFAKR